MSELQKSNCFRAKVCVLGNEVGGLMTWSICEEDGEIEVGGVVNEAGYVIFKDLVDNKVKLQGEDITLYNGDSNNYGLRNDLKNGLCNDLEHSYIKFHKIKITAHSDKVGTFKATGHIMGSIKYNE